ncbi:YjgF/Yer057p/UK114 family, partial [Penicillium maclennaniae]|uniref:YjgF/Yer057p/UK114 family n=1 Tax=Penicillium maclennaniae TaxID=1343394 RepID=UPI0025422013
HPEITTKAPVLTNKAANPLPGIYSQVIVANSVVYCSGDYCHGSYHGDNHRWRCQGPHGSSATPFLYRHQSIKNLSHILEKAGTDINKVLKVNVFLSDMDDFAAMNSIYVQYWGDGKPFKTLPLNTDVGIECIAVP